MYRRMSKYVLGEVIGRGGMGQVHSARDRYGRAVVVKRLRQTLYDNEDIAERLENEARMLERVVHYNVVRAVDRGNDAEGKPYLVMDHAAGISLGRLIDRDGPLTVQRAFAIAAQLLAGLSAIHEARVVHADMKSSNVLVDDNDRVTIIDFGLARTLTVERHREDMVAGTPAFMAPEVISGAAPTVAADIYAVGAMIYEMLTGSTPFAGSSDIFSAHLHEPVTAPSVRAPNRNISAAVDRLVLRALEKQPSARFSNVREFGAALDEVLGAEWMMTTVDLWQQRAPRHTTMEMDAKQTQVRINKRPISSPSVSPPVDRFDRPDTVHTHDQISSVLDRARKLIESHQVAAAVEMLEDGLAALTPDIASDLPLDPEAWRIETVLSALYDSQGKKERARRVAMSAYKHALQTNCKVAAARTQALIERLDQRKPTQRARFAKGSAQFRQRRVSQR
jgi:serine/threonine protein kinase